MNTTTLESLDLFRLLHLTHLMDEEKAAYLQNLVTLVLTDMVSVDLPQFMTQEEIEQFNQLTDKEETKDQAMDLLRSKVPDFDEMLKTRMLELKKDLVRGNVEERLEINKVTREELRKEPDGPETSKKILDVEQKRATLEKTLAAIAAEDWATVDSLIST